MTINERLYDLIIFKKSLLNEKMKTNSSYNTFLSFLLVLFKNIQN